MLATSKSSPDRVPVASTTLLGGHAGAPAGGEDGDDQNLLSVVRGISRCSSDSLQQCSWINDQLYVTRWEWSAGPGHQVLE